MKTPRNKLEVSPDVQDVLIRGVVVFVFLVLIAVLAS